MRFALSRRELATAKEAYTLNIKYINHIKLNINPLPLKKKTNSKETEVQIFFLLFILKYRTLVIVHEKLKKFLLWPSTDNTPSITQLLVQQCPTELCMTFHLLYFEGWEGNCLSTPPKLPHGRVVWPLMLAASGV